MVGALDKIVRLSEGPVIARMIEVIMGRNDHINVVRLQTNRAQLRKDPLPVSEFPLLFRDDLRETAVNQDILAVSPPLLRELQQGWQRYHATLVARERRLLELLRVPDPSPLGATMDAERVELYQRYEIEYQRLLGSAA